MGVFVESGESDIRGFAAAYHITYPVGKDNGIARQLNTFGIPLTIFVSRNGMAVKRYIGAIDYKELVAGIDAALK